MIRTKYCCEGQHAVIFAPLWPMKREEVKYYTAVYVCKKCHSFTIRGETNEKKDHTTFVEFISEDEAIELKTKKRSQTDGMEE